jgi:MFS family permease
MIALGVVFGAMSNAFIWPLVSTLLTRILPIEIRGRATGFQRMIENIGMAVSAMIAGYLYTTLGPANSFTLSGVLGLFAITYLIIVYERLKNEIDMQTL